jgi:hypothetical protein
MLSGMNKMAGMPGRAKWTRQESLHSTKRP